MEIISGQNKFTIHNFDKQVSAVILQRGKQYYNDGAVVDIAENQGSWTAEVEGTDIYGATVAIKNGQDISEYFCDCPYDGDICKHLVAVFFAIRDEIKKQDNSPKKAPKKNQFDDLLTKIDAGEYSQFIKHYASKNNGFKTEFELFFADKDSRIDVGEKYTDLISKLVKKHSTRGYVEYRASSALAKEVRKLIEQGYNLSHKKNYRDAFSVAKAALKQMMQVLTACDDSNGSLGGTVCYAIELISVIAEGADVAMDMKEHVFAFLQTELTNRQYFNYGDFGHDLFSVFKNLAIQLNKHEAFLSFIDAQLPKLTDRYDDYDRKFLKTEKISFLETIGRQADAEKLIQQSLDIEQVRQVEVNKAVDKKNFALAKKLITEGIKIAEDKKHPGTVTQWEKELLHIAVLENDVITVRQYCKRLAFGSWHSINSQYYNQLKQTYTKPEWQNIVEGFIDETTRKTTNEHRKNSWRPLNMELLSALAPFYIQEKYFDRLFALVKNETTLETIMKYHTYLVQPYPAELLQLYLPALMIQGDNATDRSQYAHLVRAMKMIIKDIPSGKQQIIAIAQSLKNKYPRRPAMVDELNALLMQ